MRVYLTLIYRGSNGEAINAYNSATIDKKKLSERYLACIAIKRLIFLCFMVVGKQS